jgi:hypothetical protein
VVLVDLVVLVGLVVALVVVPVDLELLVGRVDQDHSVDQ